MQATDYHADTDGSLLAKFAATHSDAPFEELIRRHGGMVYNVCFRALGQAQDSEDATQAVFITLGQKASSLVDRASIAGWLCVVARNIAQRARDAARLRKSREKEAEIMKPTYAGAPPEWEALRGCLDDELCALPEKYRLPIVLFHLEGNSTSETARLLECDEGTLRSRLSRGRELLNGRLARRGAVVSAGLLAAMMTQNASAAALPAGFAAATAKAIALTVAGHAVAGGVSANAATLAQSGLKMLFYAKLKLAASAVAATVLVSATGVAVWHAASGAQKPALQSSVPAAPALAAIPAAQPVTTHRAKEQISGRATLTGMAKALADGNAKLDPRAANATLTVQEAGDAGKATEVVYFVHGWAGIILAKQADGRRAEVSGTVAEKDGQMTLTGKSIDVKIVVVEEASGK